MVDEWLAGVAEHVPGVALVAVGGYGRQELAPASDLDVLLVHHRSCDVASIADQVWYPIWDAGFRLDHSVRTVRGALGVAKTDLKVALTLLDARRIAGDVELATRLETSAHDQWCNHARRWAPALEQSVRLRHEQEGSVAFVLEPNLKDGAGGMRDVTVLRAIASAFPSVELSPEIERASSTIFGVRVELQRASRRREDRLLLEYQDEVAAALGIADADVLMSDVAAAARTISWNLADALRSVHAANAGPKRRTSRRDDAPIVAGVVDRDGEIVLVADATADGEAVLRVAAASALYKLPIARATLRRLADEAAPMQGPWSDEARAALVDLLTTGHAAVPVFETLDQYDLVARVLPEWAAVRSRPQRNAFHRFTVDRHLVECAAQASSLTARVARPDLLLIGAWLHDLGKGFPGDHTDAGVALMRAIAARMGYDPDDSETLVAMVRYHLLLPAVATSRDLDDPALIAAVATTITSVELLDLLHALTEADSIATGPAAWNPWKAGLITTLVDRVRAVLAGAPHVHGPAHPNDDAGIAVRAAGGVLVEGTDTYLVVAAPDQPRLFSRVVGLLALAGHDVRAARARSIDGVAISEYDLEPRSGQRPDWAQFEVRLHEVLGGRIELGEALSERADRYGQLARPQVARRAKPRVIVDNEASATATVLEVHAADEVGVLHRIAHALADRKLDIRHAKISTLGPEVIDTFYVVDETGAKLVDPGALATMQAEILTALAED